MAVKRPLQAIQDDRRRDVARLRLQGLTHREIIAGLGHNPKTAAPWSIGVINKDLQAIHSQWKAAAVADIAEHKARVLAELAEVKRAAWTDKDLANLLRALKQEADLLGLNEPVLQDTIVRIVDATEWRAND
jgi:hypothetical protein